MSRLLTTLLLLTLTACTTAEVATTRDTLQRDLRSAETRLKPDDAPTPDGSLESWLALALHNNHDLRASFEQWRAATLQIAPAGALPEPTLTYGYFIRSVETRVGPQRHRLGLSQMIPWPTRLDAAQQGRAAQARLLQSEFDAAVLDLQQQLAEVYWELWRLQATLDLRAQQRPLLDALTEQAQSRVEVGRGALANLAQLNLARARLDDSLASLQSARRSAEARLLGLVGAPPDLRSAPVHPRDLAVTLPAAPADQLAADAAAHPRVARFEHLASRSAAAERGALARRYPSLMVGLDWIETGEADPGLSHTGQAPADSGKDPLIAMLSLSLPIWADSYSDEAEAARHEQDAAHERQLSATDRARGELHSTLEALRDTARRARLFDDGLLPQADLTFQTVTGAWSASQAPLSDVLLALRDLIDLRVERATLQAEHLKLWARLEFIVGHPLDRQEAP